MKQSAVGRDCLEVAQEQLLDRGWADQGRLQVWRNEAVAKVEEAVAKVQREAAPDPYKEDWYALSSKHLNEGHVAL